MIFQKSPSKTELAGENLYEYGQSPVASDEVETVVGPSVVGERGRRFFVRRQYYCKGIGFW